MFVLLAIVHSKLNRIEHFPAKKRREIFLEVFLENLKKKTKERTTFNLMLDFVGRRKTGILKRGFSQLEV